MVNPNSIMSAIPLVYCRSSSEKYCWAIIRSAGVLAATACGKYCVRRLPRYEIPPLNFPN